MNAKKSCKMNKCKYYWHRLDHSDNCLYGAKTLGEIGKNSVPTNKIKCAHCKKI